MATTKDTHTANGTLTTFGFTFPYIKQSDVKVNVDNVIVSTSDYSFSDATHVQFNTAPANGKTIDIYRSTADSNLVATFYPGSAIRSADLNDNFTQNLYTTQETTNDATDALDNSRVLESGSYVSAITKATNAVTTANDAETDADAAKLATDRLVATTSDGGSTWTLAGGNTNASTDPKGVKYAVEEAEAAVAAATLADGIADNAKLATDRLVATTSDGGSTWTLAGGNTNASTDPKGVKYAVEQAEDAVDKATTADNIADGAKEDADAAKLATDRLVATTSDGGSTWSLTGNNTNASTDPKGVGYSVTTAEAAKNATDTYVHDGTTVKGDGIGSNPKGVAYAITTAESAQASVSASAIYTVVANFAALPALSSLSEDKFYQVNDSTLIQDESTVNGEPAGFIGDDELAVKLKSNISSTPKVWEWQEYYATDPETRYRKKLIVENLRTISEDYTIGTDNNGFSIGPVTISSGKTITIPANSKYVVMN